MQYDANISLILKEYIITKYRKSTMYKKSKKILRTFVTGMKNVTSY